MNNELEIKLSKLNIEEKALKRHIDRNYYNLEVRTKLFERLKIVESEIKRINFKLMLERKKNK